MTMPKYTMEVVTSAAFAFLANIRRAQAFLAIFDAPCGAPRGKGRPSDNEKELLRAAVVFAVAALDAYLHDLVLEEAIRTGSTRDSLSEALRSIAREDPSLALRIAMADSKADRQEEFRSALDSWLTTKSFQGPEAVTRVLTYIGRSSATTTLNSRIGANWAGELQRWTRMRHELVHRAGNANVSRKSAGDCVDLVGRVQKTVEAIATAPPGKGEV
jgi:hypothetical protein